MFLVLVMAAVLLGVLSIGAAETTEQQAPESDPSFKVFSQDGSESLTALCDGETLNEMTCRFTRVRFQLPSPSHNNFPSTIEDARKVIPGVTDDLRKDPVKARREWDEVIRNEVRAFCSTESLQHVKTQIAGLAPDARRKQIFTDLLQSCAGKRNASAIFEALNEIERSTCDVWVDHFSLDFRRNGERTWLYTQEQPSVADTLKVYELAAEPQHDVWTLTETRIAVGEEEDAASKPVAERKVWSWKNWDSYEIPEQCRFLSHRLVQFE